MWLASSRRILVEAPNVRAYTPGDATSIERASRAVPSTALPSTAAAPGLVLACKDSPLTLRPHPLPQRLRRPTDDSRAEKPDSHLPCIPPSSSLASGTGARSLVLRAGRRA